MVEIIYLLIGIFIGWLVTYFIFRDLHQCIESVNQLITSIEERYTKLHAAIMELHK